mgnify:CR=1 FL=1
MIERHATEESEDKESHAFKVAIFKERLKFVIDNMDSIAKDENLPYTIRLNLERIEVDALAIL